MLAEACATCELADRIYAASLPHLGGDAEQRAALHAVGVANGNGSGELAGELSGELSATPATTLVLERSQIQLVWARALARRGQEPQALRLCESATTALHDAGRGGDDLLGHLLANGGLLVDKRAREALGVYGELSVECAPLPPRAAAQCAAPNTCGGMCTSSATPASLSEEGDAPLPWKPDR